MGSVGSCRRGLGRLRDNAHCKKDRALYPVKTNLNYEFSGFPTELGWKFQPVRVTENVRPTESRETTLFSVNTGD
jgi:hypothetical protein